MAQAGKDTPMREKHTEEKESKEIFYEQLEGFARTKIQQHLQDLLEQEVSEWLGRDKSERKVNVVEQPGYRNGYGKGRRFTLSLGTVEIKRPRVRDLGERFESRVLPLFKRQSETVRGLIPELYLHGLASGDFELALRELLGEGAPLSPSSLQRLKQKWEAEYEQWKQAPILEKDWAYLWADGIYVKAGIGKEKAALLVVIGVNSDGEKRYLALEAGYRESKESWAGVLRQLKTRGLKNPRVFIGDGNLGLWAAVSEVFPQAQEQLCWNHKMLNVMDCVSKKEQVVVKSHMNAMMYAETRQEALKERKKFEQAFGHNAKAVKTVVENWDKLTTYYDFPLEHWKHLRTSNVVESPFSRVRLRTAASRRFKSQVNATCLVWKTVMVAEKSFRKLNAPQLVGKVARGTKYDNGKEMRVAA
ncbi:MAG: IS256 family transposase [Betaproteobacteria bacterium]|nr:IS256 family transposase [Betaproteobacteria bacterium]